MLATTEAGLSRLVLLMLVEFTNGGFAGTKFSTELTAGESKKTPKPARIESLPRPKGSQANPSRGAKSIFGVRATESPYGEFLPPMMIPFRYGVAGAVL